MSSHSARSLEWGALIPYLALHVACFAVFWVGWSPFSVTLCVALYFVRMFAVTAFYHRYFSHRTFKTSRAAQFVFAVAANACAQKGPLWWASHHRHHHRFSDQPGDTHSPVQDGFFYSHVGWIWLRSNFRSTREGMADFQKFPELRWLDRHDLLVPTALGVVLFALGALLERIAPSLGTNAWQLFIWGFCVSTVVLYHGTYTINSLSHRIGWRRFATTDDSRNHRGLALLTLGEGWHNNHHHYPGAMRQGFFKGEWDITGEILRVFQRVGLIWDVHQAPARVLADNRDARVPVRGVESPPRRVDLRVVDQQEMPSCS